MAAVNEAACSNKSLLLAVAAEPLPLLTELLSPYFVVTSCTRLEELAPLLTFPYDLIIAGVHFDKSRLFDLIRECAAAPSALTTPLLCVRAIDGDLNSATLNAVRIAANVLGAVGFVDLFAMRSRYGDAEAFKRFLRIVDDTVGDGLCRPCHAPGASQ